MYKEEQVHFEKLIQKIQKPDFQRNQGLSNEVGYYIYPYNVADTPRVRANLDDLTKSKTAMKINLKVFDLYDIMLDSIHKLKGIADDDPFRILAEMEKQSGIDQVAQQINSLMRMDENNNDVVMYVQDHVDNQHCVIFITGVGKVYPLIRAHKVLNTMHQVLDKNPVVMFYPGKYNEQNLQIFGEANDQNYYRAFSI